MGPRPRGRGNATALVSEECLEAKLQWGRARAGAEIRNVLGQHSDVALMGPRPRGRGNESLARLAASNRFNGAAPARARKWHGSSGVYRITLLQWGRARAGAEIFRTIE